MSGGNQEKGTEVSVNNVTVVDGKQIIEITAKGGYLPEKSVASAGIPTFLRINTKGTFDCSSSVRVPSMNISQNLPPSGITDIDLGVLSKGILEGTCSMGMYPFEIEVKG
jgi:plastocyanin domain-containing protein